MEFVIRQFYPYFW